MIVLTLVDSPPSLRGDLTKWLQEISPGVYVGQVTTRVRDELWERVKASIKQGRATLVYSTNNEQRMEFRVHNTSWEPIDFDGLKLILRPNAARLTNKNSPRAQASTAGDMHNARKMARRNKPRRPLPDRYCIVSVDVKSTFAGESTLCGIQAISVNMQNVAAQLSLVVDNNEMTISPAPPPLTLCDALCTLQEFIGDLPLVSHHEDVLFAQLRSASAKCGIQPFANACVNTLHLARSLVDDANDYTLRGMVIHLQLIDVDSQPTFDECTATRLLYEKLIKISSWEDQ